ANETAAAASAEAASKAVNTLHAGVTEVVASLRSEITQLGDTLRSVSSALSGQTAQIEKISERSQDTAVAFGKVASDVRSASQPLLTHSARVAESTERMSTSIADSVQVLSTTQ